MGLLYSCSPTSYELTETEAAMHRACMDLHQVFCVYSMSFRLVFLMGFLSVQTNESLILVPSLGLFPFCLSVLSKFNVIALLYLIIFYFVIFKK